MTLYSQSCAPADAAGPATDTTLSVNACLTAALEYANLGIGVFPLSLDAPLNVG